MFRVVANYMAPLQFKFSTVANFQVGRPYDRYTWVGVPSGHQNTQIIAEPASNNSSKLGVVSDFSQNAS